MSSLTKALPAGLAALAVAATLFVGSAPAQARDGRNAALIGGLIVGGLIGGVLASEAQASPSYPSYQGYREYPTYRRSYGGYDDGYYAPRYRYRDYDGYRSVSGWDCDDD